MDYFGTGAPWQVSLRYSVEKNLLGSAGGVKLLEPFFDDTFVVYYGDVLTWANLAPLIDHHRQSGALATMGLYRVPDPWNRGIVQLNPQHRITHFAEKPPRGQEFSNLANAGIYVLEPRVFEYIPAGQPFDFGHGVFPAMLAAGAAMTGYVIEDPIIDIGLPEKYQEANQLAARLVRANGGSMSLS
jgi:NDP-sugar pyrophosphorylase family protein